MSKTHQGWSLVLLLLAPAAQAGTINAAGCSQANVQAAINSAADGDTVQVPAGSGCSWSGLSIAKPIHLKGPGIGSPAIAVAGVSINKQSGGVVRISRFNFSKVGGGNESKAFDITGAWLNAEPVVIQDNKFSISNSGFFLLDVAGGVIIANNDFTGDWDDSFIQPKNPSDPENSWSRPSTLGMLDVTGKRNHYIEGNTFHGGTNQGFDADDGTRVVYRYNTLVNSSFNSHGYDTSPVGVRHWEVYHNTWIYNGPVGSPPGNDLSNQGWAIWIRGGTGVIFNNTIPDIQSSWWGDPSEYKFSIRGAEDVRPQGSCGSVSYPVPRQLGQGHDGTAYLIDPIYVWGNTGPTAGQTGGWNWGNPCGLTWTNFYLQNRDFYLGTPKPGYAPYPYPHPLVGGGSPSSPPQPPRGLRVR